MAPRPYNAAIRKDVNAAEKRVLQSLMLRGEVISGIMSVSNGRQWIHELLAATHFFTDPFSPDPYIHAANSGQRGIGLQLFTDIMAFCPKHFTLMIEEHHARSTATEHARGQEPRREPDRSDPSDHPSADGPDPTEGPGPDPYSAEGPGYATH